MTVIVEFRGVGPGKCSWCDKDSQEVATVTFSDKSFVGPMCWKDLQRAIRMKVGNGNGDAKAAPPAVPAAMPMK